VEDFFSSSYSRPFFFPLLVVLGNDNQPREIERDSVGGKYSKRAPGPAIAYTHAGQLDGRRWSVMWSERCSILLFSLRLCCWLRLYPPSLGWV
jgi:hypothetical protein